MEVFIYKIYNLVYVSTSDTLVNINHNTYVR